MNSQQTLASAAELVAAVSADLTPAERRIAEAVLSDPTLLAFGTVSDLADHVDTSRPTIVRFAHKLGFDGYVQLQRHVRTELSHQLSRPSERIRRERGRSPTVQAALDNALSSVYSAVEGGKLADLAKPVVQARRVWILSGETSLAGAHALRGRLSMVRSGVHLLNEARFGVDAGDASKGDAAVVIDFYRYRSQVRKAAAALAALDVALVVITDSPLSPLVELSDTWCEIEVPPVGPFDSSVPTVAMAELLAGEVARSMHDSAAARIDHIESLWQQTGEFIA